MFLERFLQIFLPFQHYCGSKLLTIESQDLARYSIVGEPPSPSVIFHDFPVPTNKYVKNIAKKIQAIPASLPATCESMLTASPLVSPYPLIHSSFRRPFPFEPHLTLFDPDRKPWFQLKAHRVGGLHGFRKLQGPSWNGWHGERWSLRMGVPGQHFGGEGELDLELKLFCWR